MTTKQIMDVSDGDSNVNLGAAITGTTLSDFPESTDACRHMCNMLGAAINTGVQLPVGFKCDA